MSHLRAWWLAAFASFVMLVGCFEWIHPARILQSIEEANPFMCGKCKVRGFAEKANRDAHEARCTEGGEP